VNEIDERTRFNEKIVLHPGPNTQYPAIDLHGKSGNFLARIVAHELSNPKTREDGSVVHEVHEHFTIYVVKANGKLTHGLDITLNREKPQIHLHGDTIWKTKGARPILQSSNGRFYALEVREWYTKDADGNAVLQSELIHVPYDRDEVHWGKDQVVDADQ
jgi:hypothetical protein